MAKKVIPLGKPNKLFAIISAVLAVALVVCVVLNVRMSGETSIFKTVEFGDLQNSTALYADDLGYTVLGTYKNTIEAYDSNGAQVWKHDINGSVSAMAMDTELNYVIVGSQDRNLYIINIATGEMVGTYAASGLINDVDYDQSTKTILCISSVGASKTELARYDLLTGEKTFKLSFKMQALTAKFLKGGTQMVVGDNKGKMTVYDQEGNEVFSVRLHDKVRNLDVATDTDTIVAVTTNGYFYRYDSEFNEVYGASLDPTGEGYSVAISRDGKWVSVGTREGDVHIFNEESQRDYYYRANAQIAGTFLSDSVCYVITLSEDLFQFSIDKLDNIGKQSGQKDMIQLAMWVLAALLVICLIVTIPRTRRAMKMIYRTFREHRTAYLMLLPGVALILLFNYYPTVQAFIYAFTDWSKTTPTMRDVKFIGLENFRLMLDEGYFLVGIKNMLIMMVCSFAKLLTVPVILSELVFSMTASGKRRYIFRLLLVMPMVVPGVVGTLMWGNIFDPNVGFLNNLMKVLGLPTQVWLGDPKLALWCIIFMGFPWVNSMAFLIFYGGLINIPTELFEAARVDGSNRWWDFWHIKIPLITPQLKMMIITTFIGAIQDYGGILLLTKGGPGTSTYVPGLELYNNATVYGRYGYACALGLVMFVFIMGGTIVNLRMKTQEIN